MSSDANPHVDRAWVRSPLPPLIAAAVLLASMAGWTWARLTDRVGPDRGFRSGNAITLSLYDVVEVQGDHRYRIVKGTDALCVVGPTEHLDVGTYVTVHGRWSSAESAIVEDWRTEHPLRVHKAALGVLAVGFLAVGAPMWFRARRWGVAARG